MSSLKNMVVVVLLLGVSYGAFQVINAPDPTASENQEIEELDIQIGSRIDDEQPLMTGSGLSESGDGLDQLTEIPPIKPEMAPEILNPNSGSSDLKMTDSTMPGDPMALKSTSPPSGSVPNPPLKPAPSQSPPESPDRNAPPSVTMPGENPESLAQQGNSMLPLGLEPVTPKPGQNTGEPPINQFIGQKSVPTQPPSSSKAAATTAASGASFLPTNSSTNQVNWNRIEQLIGQNQYKTALFELSQFHQVEMPANDRQRLMQWLDALAGKVIYSTEHHLESQPHVVQNGETLQSIANQWKVPAELIYNINRSKIGDLNNLVAGTELKKVSGPFHALVTLDQQEMTLFIGELYAGRFSVQLGQSIEPGAFGIQSKQAAGQAGDKTNSYGKYWMGLDGNLSIHGSGIEVANQDTRGSIRLSSQDAADVYGILSEGSQVTITR